MVGAVAPGTHELTDNEGGLTAGTSVLRRWGY
jgi:hypothetical protein